MAAAESELAAAAIGDAEAETSVTSEGARPHHGRRDRSRRPADRHWLRSKRYCRFRRTVNGPVRASEVVTGRVLRSKVDGQVHDQRRHRQPVVLLAGRGLHRGRAAGPDRGRRFRSHRPKRGVTVPVPTSFHTGLFGREASVDRQHTSPGHDSCGKQAGLPPASPGLHWFRAGAGSSGGACAGAAGPWPGVLHEFERLRRGRKSGPRGSAESVASE